MKHFIIIFTITFSIITLNSCSPNACDCANILSDRRVDNDKIMQKALSSDGNFKPRNDYWASKARDCMKQYTTMTDWEIEAHQGLGSLISDKALRNAQKECASNKTYSQEELDFACDCWNQSVTKSHKAFDNMSKTEQGFRMKCFDIFIVEDAMEAACEKSQNNNIMID